jgi:hypothetical protein
MPQTSTLGEPLVQGYTRYRTLGQHLDARLARLLQSIGQQDKVAHALQVAHLLTRDWHDQRTASGPTWASEITDDHTPFEFSLALNGSCETLRILTEPQDPNAPSLRASWRSALGINEELVQRWGANLHAFETVADLFEPGANATGHFSLWHSAILGRAAASDFKVYLNPGIHGKADSRRVLVEALDRLGLGGLWRGLNDQVALRSGLDEVMYFSLDLTAPPHARAKVYVAHTQATARDVIRVLEGSPGFDPNATGSWLNQLLDGAGPFLERPPITCFALRPGSLELHSTTLHLPVRSYLQDDFEIARRACRFLTFPQRVRYMRALVGLSERPLETGRGLQTYVSLRASPGRQAVTVYLAPQVYSVTPTRCLEPSLAFFEAAKPARLDHAS